jgi:hypothetical protein
MHIFKRPQRLLLVTVVFVFLAFAGSSYAFGPLVHGEAMNKTHDELMAKFPEVPVLWTVGSDWDQLEADRSGPSHGCDVDYDAGLLNGNLSDMIRPAYQEVKEGFVAHLQGRQNVDVSVAVRRLCHYAADGMSIGQISGPDLWGRKDDMIDFACELASKKGSWPSSVHDWGAGHYEDALKDFENSVLFTYGRYRQDADKWFKKFPWFPTSRAVTDMTRWGVSQAATLTANFILLAWRDAQEETKPPQAIPNDPENEGKIAIEETQESGGHEK